jgi:hypothetical protein
MPYGTDLTNLVPTITVSAGATINPASGVTQNFTNPVVYTVTAEDGVTTKAWTVNVSVQTYVNALLENDKNVSIYPNPTSDVLYINTANEILNVRIISMDGKVILAKVVNKSINVSDLLSGTYIINIETQNNSYRLYFVKQ